MTNEVRVIFIHDCVEFNLVLLVHLKAIVLRLERGWAQDGVDLLHAHGDDGIILYVFCHQRLIDGVAGEGKALEEGAEAVQGGVAELDLVIHSALMRICLFEMCLHG